MGVIGLLTSTTSFIYLLTNFGLGTSAVKNVAAAAATGDEAKVSIVVTVLRRLVWITGILGMVLTAVLSPWLSELTFGNRDYTLAFIWISATLLFQQLTSSQMVILQGLRKLQYLAKANISGAIVGLVISIPIYYIWRLDGIVPAIMISSLNVVLLTWFFARKAGIRSVGITAKKTIAESKEMLKMGFVLSLSGLIAIGASYIFMIYLSNSGGVDQVGLYNAGFAIINTYVGMIFTALGTDYYPRLSAVAHDNFQSRQLINQQAEISILILAPILAVFLIFINWIVVLLYSQKFIAVNEMIHWAALGIFFKAASWSIAFIILAKGASKLYFWNEFLSNLYVLGFNIVGYELAGLTGLGISFLVAYCVYFIQIFFVAKVNYSFSFDRIFYKVAGNQLLIAVICFAIMRILSAPWAYILGSILIIISTFYSLSELEKRIGIKEIIQARFKDFRSK